MCIKKSLLLGTSETLAPKRGPNQSAKIIYKSSPVSLIDNRRAKDKNMISKNRFMEIYKAITEKIIKAKNIEMKPTDQKPQESNTKSG